MAVDKAVDSTQLNNDLTSVANAIRTKGGTSAQLAFPTGFVSAIEAIPTGGGGADLSWVASASPAPSVRNFFYALQNGTCEHGEFTLASTPTNTQLDLFTLTTVSAPAQGIIFIDKDFYQGITSLPNNSSDAISFLWFDKAFLNPAKESALGNEYPSYGYLVGGSTQTATAGTAGNVCGATLFDNTTGIARGYFQWVGSTLKWRTQFGGSQYTTFIAGRTYIWIAY